MFLIFKKDEKIKFLEKENLKLRRRIKLKDMAIDIAFSKLEEELKSNANLKKFRIKILDELGLIGINNNDNLAIENIKKLKSSKD